MAEIRASEVSRREHGNEGPLGNGILDTQAEKLDNSILAFSRYYPLYEIVLKIKPASLRSSILTFLIKMMRVLTSFLVFNLISNEDKIRS